jgi:hypothetical protein
VCRGRQESETHSPCQQPAQGGCGHPAVLQQLAKGVAKVVHFRIYDLRFMIYEMANPKSQIPNTKLQRNSKLQIPNAASLPPNWSLGFGTSLVLGAWCLVFSSRCLELGVWSFHSDFFRHSSFVIRHSYRSASIGSTRAARRAGSRHARIVTISSSRGTATKVAGSSGLTP